MVAELHIKPTQNSTPATHIPGLNTIKTIKARMVNPAEGGAPDPHRRPPACLGRTAPGPLPQLRPPAAAVAGSASWSSLPGGHAAGPLLRTPASTSSAPCAARAQRLHTCASSLSSRLWPSVSLCTDTPGLQGQPAGPQQQSLSQLLPWSATPQGRAVRLGQP